MEYVEIEKTKDIIKNEILSIDNILDVAEIDNSRTMLIALVTCPIYSRQEKIKLVNDVEEIVFKYTKINEILVTFDADLFYKIKASNKDINNIEKLIGVARDRIK